MRFKVNITTAAEHPLVRATLRNAIRELGLTEEPCPVYQGGHGLFYLCREDDARMLLKIPSYATRSPDEQDRLRGFIKKEAKILGEVSCAALPKLLYSHGDPCYLVREFIPGELLSERVSVDHAQTANLLMLLLRTASMVFKSFHLRDGGYVLRDFKAKNLIVTGLDDHLKLIDVDSTRPRDNMLSESVNAARVGSGKWLHWSPEQLLEDQEIPDQRTDYFALGVTAYALLSGTNPYSNQTKQRELVVKNYLSEYEVVTARLPELTQTLQVRQEIFEFLLQCLHPLPHYRPATFWIDPQLIGAPETS